MQNTGSVVPKSLYLFIYWLHSRRSDLALLVRIEVSGLNSDPDTECYRGLAQYLHANEGMLYQIRPRPLSSTSLRIHYSPYYSTILFSLSY
jgi:hypothetical protein